MSNQHSNKKFNLVRHKHKRLGPMPIFVKFDSKEKFYIKIFSLGLLAHVNICEEKWIRDPVFVLKRNETIQHLKKGYKYKKKNVCEQKMKK